MFDVNPFAMLAAQVPLGVVQAWIVLMVLAVVAGTLLDVRHKKSARYFFAAAREAEQSRTR